MSTLPAQLIGLRRSAHRRLVAAYLTVIVVTAAALWAGGAWVADSVSLQSAAAAGAASSSAQQSCANQVLGYAVDIGSAPPDSLPAQLVVELQQSVQRCDDAWQQTTVAAADVKLDSIDDESRSRMATQVGEAHDDMTSTSRQVIEDAQSADPQRRALISATVTRLAAKVGRYVDAARAQTTFFTDLSKAAVLRARLRVVTVACGVIGMVVFGFVAFIAPLHRKTAVLIDSSARSQEQDRRLSSDIARHIAERDRNEAEAQFKALFGQSSVGVVLCDLDDRILESNPALQRMLGFAPEELRSMSFNALLTAADADAPQPAGDGERLMRRKDAAPLWVEQTTTPAIGNDRRTIAVIRMIQNIERRKKAEERLRFDATHDALTGLHNRRHFDSAMDEAVRASQGDDVPAFAVLMIDLDGFKYINDTRGHAVGDAALAEVGRRLRTIAAPDVLFSRYGGDEFTAIVPRAATIDTAVALAQSIQRALQEPLALHVGHMTLSASIGIGMWSAAFADGDALLQAADSAVYKAKSAGRGKWAIYDTLMAKEDRYRRAIGATLRNALDGHEIGIAFQPIVALGDRSCIGFESLARWNHPTLGAIGPSAFIPVAEEMGLVGEIGERMLRLACEQLASWRNERGISNIKINVNVSPQQLADPEFASLVAAVLAEWKLEPKRIALELTETAIFDGREQSNLTLDALRRIGTPIMLDDFGTGFSSLTHLHRVRMDALKIDQSFVRGADGGLASAPIVQTVIALAKALGISVVAEGVETEVQATLLAGMGCHAAQGYLFGRPLTAADAIEYLTDRAAVASKR
jgi:diguanylate cyclase (GGDEF)-like protein/PAS domain S-box-containing protein